MKTNQIKERKHAIMSSMYVLPKKVIEPLESTAIDSKKLILNMSYGFKFVRFDQIVALNAYGNYTKIYLANGEKLILSKTMKNFADNLDNRFYRIHRSTIINIQMIEKVMRNDARVFLESGISFNISRREKKTFYAFLSKCIAK